MRTSKILSVIAWTLLALTFLYHILYTTGSINNSEETYSVVVLSLLVIGTAYLFGSFYTNSKDVVNALMKTIFIVGALLAIGYLSMFIIGFSSI